MQWHTATLTFRTNGKGMLDISDAIEAQLHEWKVEQGMCFLFLPHASASLTISECYDPSARKDVEGFYDRIVPEGQAWYQHTLEGSDDSPSHIRSTLTQVSLSIPIDEGRLSLGTWQGVFLFEHRARPQQRKLHLRVLQVQ